MLCCKIIKSQSWITQIPSLLLHIFHRMTMVLLFIIFTASPMEMEEPLSGNLPTGVTEESVINDKLILRVSACKYITPTYISLVKTS